MDKNELELLVWEITRPMWFLLSLLAVYILYLTFQAAALPSEYMSYYRMIPEMIKHLIMGCIVTAGFCAATEYLFGRAG